MARRTTRRRSSTKRRKSGIRIKKSHRGRLRAKTGTKKGKKIPMKTLRKKARSKSAATRKQAQFAINARKWRHK